jgi:hypothetical protein
MGVPIPPPRVWQVGQRRLFDLFARFLESRRSFSAAAADPAQAVFPYQDMALHDPCAQTGFCPMLQVMQVVTNARVSGLRSGVTLRQGAARQLGCGILCHCFNGKISKFPVVDTMPRPVDHARATRKMRSAYAFDPRQG